MILAAPAVRAQGLLSIGPPIETEVKSPWTIKLSSQAGWDTNPGGTSSGNLLAVPGTAASNQGSASLQNDISLTYAASDRINHLELSADYSNLWYADPGPGVESFTNNWKLSAAYSRTENRRWTISDTFYLAHQTQPDFSVGLTLNRPTNGSLVFFNSASASYALSSVLTLVSSYNITDVRYDDAVFQTEDYFDNLFSEQLRLQMSRRTAGSVSVRYDITNYDQNPDANSHTVFALAGMDHRFSRFLQGSLDAGAEIRTYDGPLGNSTTPYLDASLNYQSGKSSTWRWYANVGQNATGSSGTQNGLAYTTGLSYQRQITALLSLNVAVNYQWTAFSGGPALGAGDDNQQTVSASANLSYALWRNVSLTAGYTYTDVTGSTALVNAYQRQQFTLGLTATF
jgi:hypothetical protein